MVWAVIIACGLMGYDRVRWLYAVAAVLGFIALHVAIASQDHMFQLRDAQMPVLQYVIFGAASYAFTRLIATRTRRT